MSADWEDNVALSQTMVHLPTNSKAYDTQMSTAPMVNSHDIFTFHI